MAERLAEHVGAPDQVFVGQHPQHRQRRGRADRVTAECAAVQAGGEQVRGSTDGQTGSDRQTAAEALGQRHHIGGDAVVLVGEERAGAADPGLHLVEDQQRAVPGGEFAGRDQVTGRRDDDTALPHDRLQEHRSGVIVDGCGQGLGVAVRNVRDVAGQRLERRLLGRLAGQRQ